jgi:hypothetical protein
MAILFRVQFTFCLLKNMSTAQGLLQPSMDSLPATRGKTWVIQPYLTSLLEPRGNLVPGYLYLRFESKHHD